MTCCGQPMWGIQYVFSTEDYDGVSEWKCQTCGKRIGRWSGIELQKEEIERRYGGAPVRRDAEETRK